jgi:iron complex transport system substrate-binding protein
MKNQTVKTIALVLGLAFLLSACASPSSSDIGSDTSGDFETLTLDNYGREVVITEKPQRVLTMGPNCTELFIALGLADYIIGHTLNDHSGSILPQYAADHARLPQLTKSHATREVVIGSGADFIYGVDWDFGPENLEIDELASMGITVYLNMARTLEQQFQEILDIGRIFQIEQRAEVFVADQRARIQAVQDAIAGREPVRVLVYDHERDGVFTAAGDNFATLLMTLAGGKNIFGDITDREWATVSYEEVLARNPEVIIITNYEDDPAEGKLPLIRESVLAQLDSVANERFIIVDLESIMPGNRMAHAIEQMAAGFFP